MFDKKKEKRKWIAMRKNGRKKNFTPRKIEKKTFFVYVHV